MQEGKDFVVNPDGSVTRLHGNTVSKTPQQVAQDKLAKERSDLEYEIFSHPERWTPDELARKKERFAQLNEILGIDVKKSANALASARERLRARVAAQTPIPKSQER